MTVLSVRNNNPGNIRESSTEWVGEVGSSSGFTSFATPEAGVRAMTKNLYTYQSRYGATTVNDMISRWAPPNENNTTAYVNKVAADMGVSPNQPINLKDNPELTQKMVGSMISMEGGSAASTYFAPHIAQGVADASSSTVQYQVDPNAKIVEQSDNSASGNGRGTAATSVSIDDFWKNSVPPGELAALVTGNAWTPNALDEYASYAYNIELFIVDQSTATQFLMMSGDTLSSVEQGSWPSGKKVIIAKTGVTTEFVLSDLEIVSVGTTMSKYGITGAAKDLKFTLTRVGSMLIGEHLTTCALLAGYSNISIANLFVKIEFKGFDDKGNKRDDIVATKVIPFRLTRIGEVETTTDVRGTTILLEGKVIRHTGTTPGVDDILGDSNFNIGSTLDETLQNFIQKLQEVVDEKNFTGRSEFFNTYTISASDEFKQKYMSSPISIEGSPNFGPASHEVAKQANPSAETISTAQQVGYIKSNASIISTIEDICLQSDAVRAMLTTNNVTFSDLFSISIEYVPKLRGYNPITNTEGADVTYYLYVKRELIDQNGTDILLKNGNSREIVNEIVNKGRLKKIYNYMYTGYNDNVISFQISFSRQLSKTYNAATDKYFDVVFLDTFESIDSLNQEVLNEYAKLQGEFQAGDQAATMAQQSLTAAQATLATQESAIRADIISRLSTSNMFDGQKRSYIDIIEKTPVAELIGSLNSGPSDTGADLTEETDTMLGVIAESISQDQVDNYKKLQKQIEDIRNEVNTIASESDAVVQQLSEAAEQIIGQDIADNLFGQLGNFGSNLQRVGISKDVVLAEELASDTINKLIPENLLGLINVLSTSPGIFKSTVYRYLKDPATFTAIASTNREKVDLARDKYLEGHSRDYSMLKASMTIKGDPYWIDNYMKAEAYQQLYGDMNFHPQYPNNQSELNGQNYVLIVANSTDGTDDNHNQYLTNLFTYLYSVSNITSYFSNGLFTQTLEMRRMTFADGFENKPSYSGSDILDGAGAQMLDNNGDIVTTPSGDSPAAGSSITRSDVESDASAPTGASGPVIPTERTYYFSNARNSINNVSESAVAQYDEAQQIYDQIYEIAEARPRVMVTDTSIPGELPGTEGLLDFSNIIIDGVNYSEKYGLVPPPPAGSILTAESWENDPRVAQSTMSGRETLMGTIIEVENFDSIQVGGAVSSQTISGSQSTGSLQVQLGSPVFVFK